MRTEKGCLVAIAFDKAVASVVKIALIPLLLEYCTALVLVVNGVTILINYILNSITMIPAR